MGRYAQDLIDSGKVLKADTLEELAEKMGVDVDNFMEAVKKFNEAVETGVDTEFERPTFAGDIVNPNGNPALLNGPLYACLRTPVAHITKGGLKVDIDTRVISTEGTPIAGLFAAGEVTGGRSVAGLLEGITTGHRAGKTVSNIKNNTVLVIRFEKGSGFNIVIFERRRENHGEKKLHGIIWYN